MPRWNRLCWEKWVTVGLLAVAAVVLLAPTGRARKGVGEVRPLAISLA